VRAALVLATAVVIAAGGIGAGYTVASHHASVPADRPPATRHADPSPPVTDPGVTACRVLQRTGFDLAALAARSGELSRDFPASADAGLRRDGAELNAILRAFATAKPADENERASMAIDLGFRSLAAYGALMGTCAQHGVTLPAPQ